METTDTREHYLLYPAPCTPFGIICCHEENNLHFKVLINMQTDSNMQTECLKKRLDFFKTFFSKQESGSCFLLTIDLVSSVFCRYFQGTCMYQMLLDVFDTWLWQSHKIVLSYLCELSTRISFTFINLKFNLVIRPDSLPSRRSLFPFSQLTRCLLHRIFAFSWRRKYMKSEKPTSV